MPMTNRLRALDVFRGLTVAGMILVNCSGSDEVFPWADHAPWQGMTPADLVFPSFLLIMGVSAALSYVGRRARGQEPGELARRAALRAAGLFALGMLINFVIFREAHGIRWPGVLQRIALCSLGASGFLLLDAPVAEPFAAAGILIGYWLLMTKVSVPGHGAGMLTPEGNLASWLDRRLMGGHLLTPLEDQEGLLSTLPAIATTLIGLIAGRRIFKYGAGGRAAAHLGAAGLALAAVGAAWGLSFPLNKHLWTSSYALLSGGLCLSGFGLCLAFFGERPPRWTSPAEALGRHALAAYIGAGFVYGVMEFIHVRLPNGAAGNVKLWLNAHLFGWWLPARVASLAFACAFAALSAAVAFLADGV
jgi:predicted acyltransferase